jgi:pyruvate dehydrogenase E2 component (dihydrolipoyllysine-residue acetyltransferase)
MPVQIVMPSLAAGTTTAALRRWLKAEGEPVNKGEVIAEVETDKATMEMEAEETGVLGRILVRSGSEAVAVNTPIAILLQEGELPDTESSEDAASPAAPTILREAELPDTESSEDAASPTASSTVAGVSLVEASAPVPPAVPRQRRVFASPLARRLARHYGVRLADLPGSGPNGRIVRLDVERAREKTPFPEQPVPAQQTAPRVQPPTGTTLPTSPREAPATAPPTPQPMPWQAYRSVANSSMRKTIARRLVEAKQTVPHFYLTRNVELDELLSVKQHLNARADGAYRLSVNDFVVKAVALALRRVPAANSMWTEEATLVFEDVDVSVAVATDAGLITPVIRGADGKGVGAISKEVKELAARAREGKLKPEEYQGGGFTVSNLGMYGIEQFTAIVNPPQSCILAAGAGERRPVVREGAVQVRTLVTCTLSIDHRSVDGAVGAQFLTAFRTLIEDPLQLTL